MLDSTNSQWSSTGQQCMWRKLSQEHLIDQYLLLMWIKHWWENKPTKQSVMTIRIGGIIYHLHCLMLLDDLTFHDLYMIIHLMFN